MANAKPKKRAMRSRRSGVKKLKLVKANLSILSKLTALFAIILLFPLLSFSQVSSWRTTTSQPAQTSQSTQTRVQPSIPQQNNVSSWRTQTAPIRPGDNFQGQPLTRTYRATTYNPYGLQYGVWGWYQPYPYIWYDNYGWRQRSVVRIYENGRRDTIAKKPVKFTIGIGKTNNRQAAFWGTIGGKKGYFIMDYVMTYDIDRNEYYPYGNLAIADFPVSKEIFTKEEECDIIENIMHLMYEYVEENPRDVSEPDFHDAMIESIKELYSPMILPEIYIGGLDRDKIHDDFDDLIDIAADLFYKQIMPCRSFPSPASARRSAAQATPSCPSAMARAGSSRRSP
jgi:hypothetical protein